MQRRFTIKFDPEQQDVTKCSLSDQAPSSRCSGQGTLPILIDQYLGSGSYSPRQTSHCGPHRRANSRDHGADNRADGGTARRASENPRPGRYTGASSLSEFFLQGLLKLLRNIASNRCPNRRT
ncbi:hypothetical protein HJFPF1_04583 [Paramyrothecium foliicola]|nr:hypothetical protein HJFPF1_04583 [Paramyrothecium foliicola]